MRTKIFTAAVVSILGLSTLATAQQRGRPATGNRPAYASASRNALGRGPTGVGRTSQARPASVSQRPTVRPLAIPASYARFMARSVSTVLRPRPGQVAAPRGATRESMLALYREAWNKMSSTGEDTSYVEVENERGTLRTYYVDMGRTTGRVTYPENARGMNREFRHIVIQTVTSPRGAERLRIFEPGEGPGADAQPMPQRAMAGGRPR